jgi:hypothetical protein
MFGLPICMYLADDLPGGEHGLLRTLTGVGTCGLFSGIGLALRFRLASRIPIQFSGEA